MAEIPYELKREPTVEEKTHEAIDEGHDADIPSSIGYVLNDAGEHKRRASIARRSLASRPSTTDEPEQLSNTNNDGESETDIVWWDGENDAQNPYNWPRWRKLLNCVLISSLTFVTPLASSMFAPGVPDLMREFGSNSRELASFCVSVYVLGFAAGPLVLAPLSEMYGRTIVYHVCNVFFIAFIIACAKAPSLNALIAFRLLSGIFGSSPISNAGGSIADMVTQEKRAAAMASVSIGPLLGPIIGPVVGGVVSQRIGWRWVFWIIAIISGALSVVFFLFSGETYAPVLLERKAARLRKETGNPRLRSKLDVGLSPADYFKRSILRPLKMLVFSPICIVCGVWVGLAYAYLYLMFTSLTPLFMKIYGFDTIKAGLVFLGLGIGSMIGVAYYSAISDRYLKKRAAAERELAVGRRPNRDVEATNSESVDDSIFMKPEFRLPPLRIGAILLPAGLFIYGWTAEYKVHWIAPIIGTAVIGTGNLIIFMLYLVDSFTIYAASALAANSVVRSVAGAVLPLAGLPMYDKLGMGWGNSLLGFIAVAMIPMPWLFIKWGEYLRKRFEIKDL